MTLSSILNNAVSALNVNQQGLRTTSTNISNVNSPGYVRQRVHQEPRVVGDQTAGVRISEIERAADRFLEGASWSAQSQAEEFDVLSNFHERFQSLLGRPDDGSSIPGRLDKLFTSISDLSLDPTSTARRQNVVASVENFGSGVSRLADQIQKLRGDASGQIQETVDSINAILKRIGDLNPRIVRQTAVDGDTGNLEEQRSQAISELSELLDIQVVRNGDGSVRVGTSTGLTLVGNSAFQLKYTAPGTVEAGTRFSPITVHEVDSNTGEIEGSGIALDDAIMSGRLQGLIDMRDNVLPDFAAELGRLSAGVVDEVNRVHNANTAVPAPNTLEGRNTGLVGSDPHGFTGETTFAVVDAQGNEVDTVTIDFDSYGAGATLNDIISDVNAGLTGNATLSLSGGVMSFSAANNDHGVAIVRSDGNPASRGGRGFSHFFGMNDLMKSVAPPHYDTGFTGTDAHNFSAGNTLNLELRGPNGRVTKNYTLTVGGTTFNDLISDLNDPTALGSYLTFSMDSNGALTVTPEAGFENHTLFSVSDTTTRTGSGVSLSRLFGLGQKHKADAAAGVGVSDAIGTDNQRLGTARYDTGAPAGQPVITVGDGRGAQDLAAVQNKTIDFDAAGKLHAMNASVGEYAASFLSNAGLAASQAEEQSGDTEALKTEINERLSNATGVNLDEELSNMLIYQNAYNAAARVITTSQEMMDTLVGMMR